MKTIIFLFSCTISIHSFAQVTTFNNAYEHENYSWPNFSDLIVHEDTIVAFGMARNISNDIRDFLIGRFDTLGQIIDTKLVPSPFGGSSSNPLFYGRITKSSQGGYIFTGLTDNDGTGAVVVKIDDELNTEWFNSYVDDEGFGGELHDPIEVSDGYILYGTSPRYTLPIPFVFKIDYSGNLLWLEYYGHPNVSEFCSWEGGMLEDSTIVIGAISESKGTVIQKIDLEGDLLDVWESGTTSELGFFRGLYVIENGDMIIFSQKVVGENDGEPLYQPTLSRLSSNYEIEWTFSFGHIGTGIFSNTNRIWDIQSTSDGNFICTGESYLYNPKRQAGWLFKFTPQGDSIWSHRIDPPLTTEDISTNWYGGIGELRGGESYITAGRAQYPGHLYMWLTKVDRNGCLEDFCPDVYVSTDEILPINDEGPLISPNPNRGTFQLSWDNDKNPFEPFTLTVYNTNGHPLWQQENIMNTPINLSFFPKGAYFLSIKNESGHWRKKWIHN